MSVLGLVYSALVSDLNQMVEVLATWCLTAASVSAALQAQAWTAAEHSLVTRVHEAEAAAAEAADREAEAQERLMALQVGVWVRCPHTMFCLVHHLAGSGDTPACASEIE